MTASLILRRECSRLTIAQDCRMWPALVSNWKFFKYFCLNSNSSALLYFSMTQVLDLRAIGIYLSLKQYFFIWFKNCSMVSEGGLDCCDKPQRKPKSVAWKVENAFEAVTVLWKWLKAFMNIEKPNSTILTVISILDAFSDANKMAISIKT